MSALSAREVQFVAELADALYEFLPGTPHPRTDERLSFPGAARVAAVSAFWTGGSKRPAIAQLLRSTLEQRRGAFFPLIAAIVNSAIIYRRKKNPLTRIEVDAVNRTVAQVGFKIPELHDTTFLDSLVSASRKPAVTEGPPPAKVFAASRGNFSQLQHYQLNSAVLHLKSY